MRSVAPDFWFPKQKPPVTLSVNQESRSETLLHYTNLSTFIDTPRNAIFFSPRRDILYLGSFLGLISARHCITVLRRDPVYIIEQLSHIQVLGTRIRYLEFDYFRQLLLVDRGMKSWRCLDLKSKLQWVRDESELEGGILAKFHGLNKLFIRISTYSLNGTSRLWNSEEIEGCKEVVRQFFEYERQKWPNCKIPEVIVLRPMDKMVLE